MLFDWSAECAADDPVLVVPWSSSDAALTGDPAPPPSHFVDLRHDPYAVDEIPEAELHPPLLQALRALNTARSPVFTAKCDAWPITFPEELDRLRLELDLPVEDTLAAFASYIDLLWRDRTLFASFHQHEHLLHRIARRAAPLDLPLASVEVILRPALVDLAGPHEGFALTLYVKALGFDEAAAYTNWGNALDSIVGILRSRDLTPNT